MIPSGIFLTLSGSIYWHREPIVQWCIEKAFHSGFLGKGISPEMMTERRRELIETHQAKDLGIEGLDALYLPSTSSSRTGNVVVFCLTHAYQRHRSRHLQPFLDSGADVVVWNPRQAGSFPYAEDLSTLLQKLRENHPRQTISLKTYCATTDPAIATLADMNDKNIHLIVDRGHGNAQKLAQSFTCLARLPLVQRILKKVIDCKGAEKINQVRGRILFITPKTVDQVMDYGKEENLTRDLHTKRPEDSLIEMETGHHWSPWDAKTYNLALQFLSEVGVVARSFAPIKEDKHPTPPAPTYCQQYGLSFYKTVCGWT